MMVACHIQSETINLLITLWVCGSYEIDLLQSNAFSIVWILNICLLKQHVVIVWNIFYGVKCIEIGAIEFDFISREHHKFALFEIVEWNFNGPISWVLNDIDVVSTALIRHIKYTQRRNAQHKWSPPIIIITYWAIN